MMMSHVKQLMMLHRASYTVRLYIGYVMSCKSRQNTAHLVRHTSTNLDHALLFDRFHHFTFHISVRYLAVTLDSALPFSQHISNLTRSSYFQLRRLKTIRKTVSVPGFTSIVHAFVCSRSDCCNSLLIGIPKTRSSLLQTVLDAAARLVASCQTSPLLPYIFLHQGTSPLAYNLYSHSMQISPYCP